MKLLLKILFFSIFILSSIFFLKLFNEVKKPISSVRHQATIIGKQAKEFHLQWMFQTDKKFSIQRFPLSLKLFKGKLLLLNFWASWCHSCREEAIYLSKLQLDLDKKQGAILGVAVFDELEDSLKVASHLNKNYPLAYDPSGKTSLDYGLTGVPETLLLGENGQILFWHKGPLSQSIYEKLRRVIISHVFS